MPEAFIAHPDTSDETIVGGDLVPEGFRLTEFAGALPLGPGDVLSFRLGTDQLVATGVVTTTPTWVVEFVAPMPHPLSGSIDWAAAEMRADELADACTVFPVSRRLTKFTVRVMTPDWAPIGRFVEDCPHVWMYEIFRTPSTALTWDQMLLDPYGVHRPSFLRDGAPV